MIGAEEIRFSPEDHTYWRADGQEIPSVTTILKKEKYYDYSMIPRRIIEPRFILGRNVHSMCAYDAAGDLDESSVTGKLVPYFDAWKKFRKEVCPEFVAIETVVYSPTILTVGTIDFAANLFGKKRLSVVDIKITEPCHWHRLQTAAYKFLANDKESTRRIAGRYCLYLKCDGTYGWEDHRKTEKEDIDTFIAARIGRAWKEKYT